MANFRTTLWFKKGELLEPDPLPIEDRYADDGSVDDADRAAFSLQTGQTQTLAMIKTTCEIEPVSAPPPELIRQLKAGRARVVAALAGTAVLIGAALYVL